MGRFKIKKQDTFIDMTPMSDVMVLLLTFFMLTATFVKDEPVKVNVPGSVAEIKIPENNLLTIFVDTRGKVFLCMDTPETQRGMAEEMIREERDQILDAKEEDIRALADVVAAALACNQLCVIGGEDKIEEQKDLFMEVKNLF